MAPMTWWRAADARRIAELEDALRGALGLAEARQEAVATLRDEIVYLRQQIAEKDRMIVTMKRDGFDPTQLAVSPTAEPPEPLDPAIEEVIESFAEPGTSDYYEMLRDARRATRSGASVDEIVAEIRAGSGINPHWL